MTTIRTLIATAVERPLTRAEAEAAFSILFAGDATPVQVAGFAIALRAKGESVGEISGLSASMLTHATPIHLDP